MVLKRMLDYNISSETSHMATRFAEKHPVTRQTGSQDELEKSEDVN